MDAIARAIQERCASIMLKTTKKSRKDGLVSNETKRTPRRKADALAGKYVPIYKKSAR